MTCGQVLVIINYSFVQQIDIKFKVLKHAGNSDLVLWEDLEGAGGEGSGRGDRDGEDM